MSARKPARALGRRTPGMVWVRTGLACVLMQAWAASASTTSDLLDLPFEELLETEVSGASAFVREVTDAPSAVSVVTAEEIRQFGYRNLAEILDGMRGLHLGFDGLYYYLGGRGFGKPGEYAGRIALLVDGYPVADSVFNQLYMGDDGVLDPSVIERVEYAPGPGAAVYGNNAFLGVLNVITRKGRDVDGTDVALLHGSNGDRKVRLTTGRRLDNGADILFSVATHRVGLPTTRDVAEDPAPTDRDERLFLKVRQGGWWLESAWARRDRAAASVSNASTSNGRDQHAFWQTGYDADWQDMRASLKLYQGSYKYNFHYTKDEASSFEYFYIGRWSGAQAQLAGTLASKHRWTVGAEYRSEPDFQFGDSFGGSTSSDAGQGTRSWGVYAQDEIHVLPEMDVNLGLRYDQRHLYGRDTGVVNPRVALLYRLGPDTTLKWSHGSASRWMGGDDRMWLPEREIVERVRTTEFVAERAWPEQGLRLAGSLYRYRITDLKEAVFNPSVTYLQTRGAEVELEWRRNGVMLRASHAWQMARNNLGEWQVNVPRTVTKLQLSVPLDGDRWRASLALRAMGRRLTSEGTIADGYAVADLTLMRRQLVDRLDVTFAIRNLFNRRYGDVVSYTTDGSGLLWRDGRTYWLQLEYRFK
jgi:outer membrane receptor for ferrienterochelin and colicin